ncbi:MAG: ABC transporter substrate-binding protein, partial [Oscillospiraceae bacterium]|nr:ABC transporter substrate-binding protein [Oscillospiraceae bacterium]
MRRGAFALLLAAMCLLVGCASWEDDLAVDRGWEDYQQMPEEEPEVTEETEPEYPAAFSLAYHKDQSLDPISCAEGVQEVVASLLYEPLFRLDGQFQAVPLLCESYEWNETGLVCTLTLRQDVLFSDGAQLAARDVVETLQRAMASERYAYRLRNVTGVTADRSGRVLITLAVPDRGLPELLDIPIVKQGTAASHVPTGTGPYLLDTSGDGACLTANEAWWQHRSLPVDTIPLVHAKDRDTALYLFSSHQVELLTVDPTDDLAFVSGQAQTAEQPTAILQFIGFNTAEGRLFANPALRRAFSLGIQRDVLVNAQLADLALAAWFPVSPLSPLYPKDLEQSHTAEETAAALKAAGQDTGVPRDLKPVVSSDDNFRTSSARFIASGLTTLDW